ncbi:MAG: transcription-repair coupling factor, partial [Coriobacteriaceae bacterium]|nr:transcription-repair coupling factor [Coriobacteriaceae bacterium]
MLIDALAETLGKSGALDGLWNKMDALEDAAMGVASSARPFLVAARFARTPQPTLVVVPGEDAAAEFARVVSAYVGEERVLRYPARRKPAFEVAAEDARGSAMRLEALNSLATARECIVVASGRSLLRKLPPKGAGVHRPLVFTQGEELEATMGFAAATFEELEQALVERGYENTGELEGPGTFAVRGGTIDLYAGNLGYPVRIDFFGDEVDEIRRIVPATGQSIASLKSIEVYPVREYLLGAREVSHAKRQLAKVAPSNSVARTLFEALDSGTDAERPDLLLPYLYDKLAQPGDYLPAEAVSVLVEPRAIFDDAAHAFEELEARAKGGKVALDTLYAPPASMDFGACPRCTYGSIIRVGGGFDSELKVLRTNVAGGPEKLFGRLHSLVDDRMTVVFSVPNYRAREEMKLSLVELGVPITEWKAGDGGPLKLKRGVVNVVDTEIPLGMVFPQANLALVSINDTQGSGTIRTRRHVDITQVTFPYKPGDYVVHVAHGIALFKELVRQDVDGSMRDYLLLEYADNDKLYVPVEQLDRISRYVGPEGASPRLTRLNTADWSRAMNKARKATKKLAFDLVDIYTRRAATKGYRYSPDTPWQRQMEDAFPYQETADQLSAIADIKADMESIRPMDRLVCGDVGFGKTEVALRAAFKATQDHKQVMVLCPTTILAQQHYTTFRDRFEPFGLKVEVLSRFRTGAQQADILEQFAQGEVAVLVGTHRLLSADVNPHDLGLLIIDEEQRFGVGAKEQMKNLRESIDVLTLSATPIPRTMQMSLSGVRDMSLILTPPDDRRPVQVVVGEWDPDLVADGIRREIARGGQVYYVSNRVKTIDDAVERVQSAVGEARIGVAHGQMSKEQLEHVMEDFSAGEIDVLVATTIIESGIDNPHTNTLIIEDSQRLGLAQLYQLKGRVGRSSTQAYAYFMFPDNVPLTDEAMERLQAINDNRELGSGMRIAMKDLEIRGAGSMIGAEQSGNLSAVGFDLFAQMLAEAVNATREGRADKSDLIPPALSDITVNVHAHAYLPEEYVQDPEQRVTLYRKLASCDDLEVLEALEKETRLSYGEMPAAAQNFFAKAHIKALAYKMGIKVVSAVAGNLVVEPVSVTREQLIPLKRKGGRYIEKSRRLMVSMRYFKVEDESKLS